MPVNKRIAIALWRLATNNEYRSVSHLFGVGISTVCRCVQDFCYAVIKVLLSDHIKTPDTRKLIEMATYFDNRWRAPQCVGAIDSSHIPILAPELFPRDFYNRKGWHSIILQGVVDGKGLFWDVCVGFPGSVHDARVLRQSHFWEIVGDGQFFTQHTVNIAGHDIGHYIIGDSAYPLKCWLMKPVLDTGRLTQEKHNYNAYFSLPLHMHPALYLVSYCVLFFDVEREVAFMLAKFFIDRMSLLHCLCFRIIENKN